nr:uncharacterized protein LOC115858224 isoform X3 [Globicephala melas]
MATVTLWRARCILAASLDNPHANSLKNKGRGARDPRGRSYPQAGCHLLGEGPHLCLFLALEERCRNRSSENGGLCRKEECDCVSGTAQGSRSRDGWSKRAWSKTLQILRQKAFYFHKEGKMHPSHNYKHGVETLRQFLLLLSTTNW